MRGRQFLLGVLVAALEVGAFLSRAQGEKISLGTPTRGHALYLLPGMAAEEKGFWKQEGIEAEWVSFRTGRDISQGVVAGSVHAGITPVGAFWLDTSRGLPIVIVADLKAYDDWELWVKADSPFKQANDLKGTKIGVTALGRLTHANAELVARSLGIEKLVKFVSVGGGLEMIAALKSGAVESVVLTIYQMFPLKYKGEVRSLAKMSGFLGKDWDPLILFSTKKLIQSDPNGVRALVRGTIKATSFVIDNPSWSVKKISEITGLSPEGAAEQFKMMTYSRDGAIEEKDVNIFERVKQFLIEFKQMKKEAAPALADVYSRQFVPGR